MYFLKDDRKAHFNAWKYPTFYHFPFFETFRGTTVPQTTPCGAAPAYDSPDDFDKICQFFM